MRLIVTVTTPRFWIRKGKEDGIILAYVGKTFIQFLEWVLYRKESVTESMEGFLYVLECIKTYYASVFHRHMDFFF